VGVKHDCYTVGMTPVGMITLGLQAIQEGT
jgi:hypothetical protein